MKVQKAIFINLNVSPLLKGSEATNITFKRSSNGLQFQQIDNICFRNNLILVDGLLPQILGEVLLYAHTNSYFEVAKVMEAIEQLNPLQFRLPYEIRFYTYKIKELLKNLALGMNAFQVWNGAGSIYEHFPVLKHKDELLYYSDARFLETLYKKARFRISQIQEVKQHICLNLQIEIQS